MACDVRAVLYVGHIRHQREHVSEMPLSTDYKNLLLGLLIESWSMCELGAISVPLFCSLTICPMMYARSCKGSNLLHRIVVCPSGAFLDVYIS